MLSQKLRECLREVHLSRDAFAKRVGCSRATVQRILAGGACSLRTAQGIVRATDGFVTEHDVLCYSQTSNEVGVDRIG